MSVNDTLDILYHVGVINTDLNALSEKYEKLGFLLTLYLYRKSLLNQEDLPNH
jgi:hypothetical protein